MPYLCKLKLQNEILYGHLHPIHFFPKLYLKSFCSCAVSPQKR